jgi:hypothetical protein
MSITIAKHYYNELIGWNKSMAFHLSDIVELEKSLSQIISRNSIVDIAAKAEVHQLLIDKITDKIHFLQNEISTQEEMLKIDQGFISDEKITGPIEKKQNSLTQRVKHIEKEFVDVKFYCNAFLSEMLKR